MATFREYGKALENFDLDEGYLETYNLASRFVDWFRPQMHNIIVEERMDLSSNSSDRDVIYEQSYNLMDVTNQVIGFFHPNLDPEQPGFLAIWPDKKARGLGRKGRVYLRTGRAIRKMFPCLNDSEIATLVDKIREVFAEKNYLVQSGKERQDFSYAYATPHDTYENPVCTYTRKHLSTSCMRYSFDRLQCHPTEAYASGDFTIFWAERDGKIAGRCVVMTAGEDWHAGPVYGVSEKAIDLIWDKIKSECPGHVYDSEASCWEGAKMLNIPHNRTSVVAPYLDVTPRRISRHSDEFLVIDSDGEFDASCYQGVLTGIICCQCDENMDQCDVMYLNDGMYCETCFHDRFSYCERCGEYEPAEDCGLVYRARYHNQHYPYEETWCSGCSSCHAVETVNNEMWAYCDVLVIHTGEYISPRDIEDGYFYSDWNGEIYEFEHMVEVNGETVSRTELENQPLPYKQNNDGTYVLVEETNDKTETHMESEADA